MRKEWTETTLGEIAEWFSGGTPKAGKSEFYEGGDIPWVVIADLMKTEIYETATCITAAGLSQIGGRLAPVGSVLISMYATVGRPGIAHVPVATNQAIAWSVPNPKLIESRFLLLVAQSLEVEISSMARGATQRNINRAMLRDFKFLLPPRIEQKRIVNVVSSVDAYIDALQQQADKARGARDAVLHKLLSISGDDWTETTLGEIASFYNGKTYKQEELLESGKYRVLRVGNFFSNGNWYWSDLELEENKYCDKGDLLYAWSASFGPRIWSEEKVIYHYHIWKIVEDANQIDKKFLYYWLDEDVLRMKRDTGNGSIMMHITKSGIEARKIQLPPLIEQKRIVEIVSSMDEAIQSTEQAVENAKVLRSGMLSDLLSGNHEIPASYDSLLGAA
jgi:type I restriction enzyme S subunit